MDTNELIELLKAVNTGQPKINQTFNFNAPVGQQIAHVDKIEAHFGNDMDMQIVREDEVMSLFTSLTQDAINKFPNQWKEILKPYRSAIDAGVMDRSITRLEFNKMFGVDVVSSAFSRWISANDPKYSYNSDENGALIEKFASLRPQKS